MAGTMGPRRKPTRLRAFDYRSEGPYFVTICVQHREHRFSDIVLDEMHLNAAGEMVAEIWTCIPDQFPTAILDGVVVMPNHVHGIMWFEPADALPQPALGDVLGWFKAVTTNRYIYGVRNAGWPSYDRRLWQRTYHEHIVRTDADLERIRTYIANNPATWRDDTYHSQEP